MEQFEPKEGEHLESHDLSDAVSVNEEPKVATEIGEQKKSLGRLFAFGIGGILLLALIGAGVYGYVSANKGATNPFAKAAVVFFDMPVAVVNGQKISYADFDRDMKTLKHFISQSGGQFGPLPTDQQISEQVLSRLMVNVIVGELAKEFGATLKDTEVEKARANILSKYESEQAANDDFQTKYQWTLDQYIDRIVKPFVLEQSVSEALIASTDEKYAKYESGEERKASHILFTVAEEKTRKEVKKLAETVLKDLKGGANFEEMASQYGSDGTKDTGGDLGWFGKGAMVEPFEKAVFTAEPGTLIPTLVETQFGYHIVKVVDKRMAKDFDALMRDRLTNATVTMYMGQQNPYAGTLLLGQ